MCKCNRHWVLQSLSLSLSLSVSRDSCDRLVPCSPGEFPALQTKMRSVLRVEVEAVRFLKEEPHKMDSMLKRVKALTETLSCLRR